MKDVWLVYSFDSDGEMMVFSEHDNKVKAQEEASRMNSKPLALMSFGFISAEEIQKNFRSQFRMS